MQFLKSQKSFEGVRNEVRKISLDCWDIPSIQGHSIYCSALCSSNSDLDTCFQILSEEDGGYYAITDLALFQLCNKLGLPVKYFKRLRESDSSVLRNLAIDSLNTLLAYYDKPFFFRMYQDKLRGVLSERYSNFDSPEIMDILCETFNGTDFVIRGSEVSYEDFHLRVTTQQPFKISNFDKDVYLGMQITSSDVGKSTLSVSVFIWKEVCTNGMCLPIFDKQMFRQKHIGIKEEIFSKGFKHSVEMLPLLQDKVADLLFSANSALIDKNIFNVKTPVGKAFKEYVILPDKDISTLKELNGHYSNSVTSWSVASAITEFVQGDKISFDRRLNLERIAGEFLSGGSKKFFA